MRILQQEGWNLYLLMRQRAVPNRKKPGNTTGYLTQTERRTKVRLGQADAAADTVDEQAAAALKATWSLVLSSCCVLWIDNWYRAQYTTHPDESDRSQNCTAMAVLQLKQRPTYWAGHPAIEGKRRNRTSPRNQTTTILTMSQKKTIWSKYWRPSRSASGHPPLTSMQAAPTLVRNSPRRKRRLLPVLLQSSSRPRVLVPCRLEVPLPLQVGQVQQQEAWVPGWLRLLDRRRSKSPLTQVLRLFLQS